MTLGALLVERGCFVRKSIWNIGQGQVCTDKVRDAGQGQVCVNKGSGYRAGVGLHEQGSGCYTAASLASGIPDRDRFAQTRLWLFHSLKPGFQDIGGGAGRHEQGSGCFTATSLASRI